MFNRCGVGGRKARDLKVITGEVDQCQESLGTANRAQRVADRDGVATSTGRRNIGNHEARVCGPRKVCTGELPLVRKRSTATRLDGEIGVAPGRGHDTLWLLHDTGWTDCGGGHEIEVEADIRAVVGSLVNFDGYDMVPVRSTAGSISLGKKRVSSAFGMVVAAKGTGTHKSFRHVAPENFDTINIYNSAVITEQAYRQG